MARHDAPSMPTPADHIVVHCLWASTMAALTLSTHCTRCCISGLSRVLAHV